MHQIWDIHHHHIFQICHHHVFCRCHRHMLHICHHFLIHRCQGLHLPTCPRWQHWIRVGIMSLHLSGLIFCYRPIIGSTWEDWGGHSARKCSSSTCYSWYACSRDILVKLSIFWIYSTIGFFYKLYIFVLSYIIHYYFYQNFTYFAYLIQVLECYIVCHDFHMCLEKKLRKKMSC